MANSFKPTIRLDKLLSHVKALSRTQAKQAISKGQVSVDEQIVKDPSSKIGESSKVIFNGELVTWLKPRYLMLNKPKGWVCTSIADDSRSVLSLLINENFGDLHFAGRLDLDTTGLVLLTNDGEWSHQITSPKKQCGKVYRVELTEPVDETLIEQFQKGIQLKGERNLTRAARLEILSEKEVRLTIHEGKYHQVKRMFAAVGNHVLDLHREQIAHIKLDSILAPGEWRMLSVQEINLGSE